MRHFIIFFTLLFLVSLPVSAQTPSPERRAVLAQQLQILMNQVIVLQAQLAQLKIRTTGISHSQDDLYPTDFYAGEYAAAYTVKNHALLPMITTGVRIGDKALFETFIDLAGQNFVDTYISEFRIFNDSDSGLGGFVQQKLDQSWILALNGFDENLQEAYVRQDMSEMMLHEYAHILFFEDTTIGDAFTDTFWDSRLMQRQNSEMEGITDIEEIFEVNYDFYTEHEDLFVSEYAATAPVEDLVESFTAFVLTDRPEGDIIADEKIRFFYDFDNMLDTRIQLRKSGVLTLQ